MFELIPSGFQFDFIGRRHLFANISWAAAAISLLLIFFVGPNWGIDFTGGTEVEVAFAQPTTVEEVRGSLKKVGVSDDAIQSIEDDGKTSFLIRTTGESAADPAEVEAVRTALLSKFGQDFFTAEGFKLDAQVGTRITVEYTGAARSFEEVTAAVSGLEGVSIQSSPEENTFYVRLPGLAESIRDALAQDLADRGPDIKRTDTVGPKVGDSLRTAGVVSLLATMGMLLVYIGFRFDFAFAPGAILCLFHDSCMLVGFWVATQQEFGLSMISALLTLLGYSINDTIVVYDRIRENMEKYRSRDFAQLINDSINQTLSRTIMTSAGTAVSMIPFLIWGGPVLFQFAEAMLFGIVVGTYSSVYVAAPLTIALRENRDFFARLIGGGKKPAKAGGEAPPKA